MADIVQLSIYGTSLNWTTDPRVAGHDVADYGYVRMPTVYGVVWACVPLLKPAAVVELWADYWRRNGSPRVRMA